MSEPILSASQVLAWHEVTSERWKGFLTAHPELLAMPCDIAGTHTLGETMQHIVAVELRYAERLANLPETDYASVPFDSVGAIYATHDKAAKIFREVLASPDVDWDGRIEFMTRSRGAVRSSRRTILFHALLHSVRHYGQLATLARQHGVAPDWPMDYLFMDMERV
jgi:uncharacterized damage-inducible protein DinB